MPEEVTAWEKVTGYPTYAYRLKVPGGWLYQVWTSGSGPRGTTFVPDPQERYEDLKNAVCMGIVEAKHL